jgi:uncharacterized phage infection (PIP) family protein YhgE
MGLVYFVVKRRLLLTDLPATTAPGPDLQAIIHAEFAALVPGLRSELLVFAETRLQQLAKERDEKEMLERQRQYMTFETQVKAAIEGRFDQLLREVIGMTSTMSGIRQQLNDSEKRRTDQIKAIQLDVDTASTQVKSLRDDVMSIKRDLYPNPEQPGNETLFSLVRQIRADQSDMKDKLEELERDGKDTKQQLSEASAFIANRRTIENAVVRAGSWLWRNKVKGVAIITAVLTSGAAGAGVFSTIAQLVTKVLQP